MTDYIKREDAKDAVINIVGWEKIAKYVDEMSKHPSTKDIDYYDALMDAEDAIDDLPSADVAPVRHGRWVESFKVNAPPTLKERWICSWCGNVQTYGATGYCPNCGAKMDEEVEA